MRALESMTLVAVDILLSFLLLLVVLLNVILEKSGCVSDERQLQGLDFGSASKWFKYLNAAA